MNRKHKMLKFVLKPDKNRLWENIEPFLPNDKPYQEINRRILLKGLQNLPVMQPQRDIWENLKSRLNPVSTPKIKVYLRYAAGIAAAMIILVSLHTIFFNNPDKTSSVNNVINSDNDIEVFLADICNNNPNKCNNPDFLELKDEILTLHSEKSQINNQVFYNENDQNIKNTMDKIDEQIVTLKKQIEFYVSL